jgi:sugar O-acyltransferase (sialic acid O-acetyltransferase NeuD family)
VATPPSRFLIWGGGGHGKVVADLVRAVGGKVIGFVDRDPDKLGQEVEPGGARVIQSEKEFLAFVQQHGTCSSDAEAVVLAVGDNRTREQCARRLADLPLPCVVHPSATTSPSAAVGRGTVVFAGAIINAEARLGDAVIINSGAIVEHDCRLGDGCHLSPGAILGGGVRVGARSWIGAGATVVHAVSIGSDVIVGAGAVIIRDVPDGVTIVGNPGRVIHERQAV